MGDIHYLYKGHGNYEKFELPEGWKTLITVKTEERALPQSVSEMAFFSFLNPVGTPPLKEMVSKAKKIAIVVDDGTRPTPVKEILKPLLSIIEEERFPKDEVVIVVALGTHEPMKKEALEGKLGDGIMESYRVIQHNAWQDDLVPFSIPDDLRIVKVNPHVAMADLKIGISSILPHPMAGYGGGPKIIMPGVCDFDFIRDHHMKHVTHPRSKLGVIKGNPFHEDLMKTVKSIGLNFSVNCLYDQKGVPIKIISGSMEEAFHKSVLACVEILGCKFEEKVDITITSTYPHTHGHQLFKGLSAPDMITYDSGAILLYAPLVGPMSKEFIDSFNYVKEKSGNMADVYVKEKLSEGSAFLPDKSIDFNMAMSTVFLRPKIRTIIVSDFIREEEAKTMGLEYASSIEEGIERLKKVYPEANLAVFPVGGLIVPVTEWDS
ncbi:MAG: lactate racemase domain-containing protein [Syntrophorhabdaceae bacterium]|nr:lactate racemase domain-containing protein [Syntrophorhabdaceae bacterium]